MDLEKEVQNRLEKVFEGAEVMVDFADQKHMAVQIKVIEFAGKTLLEQHKLVYAAVQDLIDQGYLHALKIKTIAKQ